MMMTLRSCHVLADLPPGCSLGRHNILDGDDADVVLAFLSPWHRYGEWPVLDEVEDDVTAAAMMMLVLVLYTAAPYRGIVFFKSVKLFPTRLKVSWRTGPWGKQQHP